MHREPPTEPNDPARDGNAPRAARRGFAFGLRTPRAWRCASVTVRIDDHVDGLLPAEEAERVRDHLDRCEDCRETAAAAKAASTSLAVWGDMDPPTDCFDRILTRIDALPPSALERPARRAAPTERAGRLLRAWAPTLAAAAAVVAAFVVVDGRERERPALPSGAYAVGPSRGVPNVGMKAAAAHLGGADLLLRLDQDLDPGLRIQPAPAHAGDPFGVFPVDYDERYEEIWRAR